MTDINPTVAAARESARHPTGQFGTQEHTAPELELRGPYLPGQPVLIDVTYEEYHSEHDENPEQVHTQKVDVASVLDTWPLEAVQHLQSDPWADSDSIIFQLQGTGELTHPSHPFTVDFHGADLDAYIHYRESTGLGDPVAEKALPSVENLRTALAAQDSELAALHAQLAELESWKAKTEDQVFRAVTLAAHPEAAKLVVQADHHRYPVELYDASGEYIKITEDQESTLIEQFREVLGEDPAVLGSYRAPRAIDLVEKE